MNWHKVKNDIYYVDGSLRDIFVSNTTKENWSQWADYVNENYAVEWYSGKTKNTEDKIDFSIVLEYWEGTIDLCSTAKIFTGNIQINVHFFDVGEFENDISPEEFTTIKDHDLLLKYLTDISKLFNKTVCLTPEEDHLIILFDVSGDEIRYY